MTKPQPDNHSTTSDTKWNSKGVVKGSHISDLYGENVYTIDKMAKSLSKSVYTNFIRQRLGSEKLKKSSADAIALAAKTWAIGHGATHFTHWFQPQTGATAEKHDSFLSLMNVTGSSEDGIVPMESFSGGQLLQSEPDASSFPSGGMRTTFEARGYTIWDTSSPMFVRNSPNNTKVLYIPSVYISYNGEALDEKTILLRSSTIISQTFCEFLSLLDPHSTQRRVVSTVGIEQEFFLIDKKSYDNRLDLRVTGRTIIGSLSSRHQQLEDHYFGKIPGNVLKTMSDFEVEAISLGIPIKTRHNEVAPSQFEIAPVFEEASIAIDHNLLTMDILHNAAEKNGLKTLFHEKPFQGINGSGKHCNWSLLTDNGENLLDPTDKPEENMRFILVLLAVLKGVLDCGPILCASISSSSNKHRLGANEAPPAIISVFLGSYLTEVLDSIEEGRKIKDFSIPQYKSIQIGGTELDLKVSRLPTICRDLTDRNRTSPFAFTGNKFEFRALGSKQSPSFPVTILNTAVSVAMQEIINDLKTLKGSNPTIPKNEVLEIIKKYIKLTKPVRFEGDNYSKEWIQIAEKRGLVNIKNPPEAYSYLMKPKYQEILVNKTKLFTVDELISRVHILNERYAKNLIIEGKTAQKIVNKYILPRAIEYKNKLANAANSTNKLGFNFIVEKTIIEDINTLIEPLFAYTRLFSQKISLLENNIETSNIEKSVLDVDEIISKGLIEIRSKVDKLEDILPKDMWPFPSYADILLNN
ncbi:hypothetical protein BB558_000494 [Smittium angustum]|uniref:Uncharacterized protein n=1 Tax=Smittium angustum TaxID=133377 RepID=A0A2U1JEB6_SMIAN|nr:hypothetical protein BB558_007663 [Smittium angustum]PWA03313.1 hypothetical protein BB558_000494 [Smittium angustum]